MFDLKIGDYVKWIGHQHHTQAPLFGWITEIRGDNVWIATDRANISVKDYSDNVYCDAPKCWEMVPTNARLVTDAADSAAYYDAVTGAAP